MKALFAYIGQVGIALDQMLNALWPSFLWGHLSYADETLSARTWRGARANKRLPRLLLPVIDAMFLWQTPDVADEDGTPIRSHCHRAYLKEAQRRGLPPEYRDARTAP